MRSPQFLFLTSVFAACSYPSYVATRVVQSTAPAEGLHSLVCNSHNGDIQVNGDSSQSEVAIHVELSARGYTQAEAEDNVTLLQLGQESVDGTLRIAGKCPEAELQNMSPSFEFTLLVPKELALTLTTHNGDISVRDSIGDQRLTTHNGSIDAHTDAKNLAVETHNGRIGLAIETDGPVHGNIESHNGSVDVRFGDRASAALTATTHNGSITPSNRVQDADLRKNKLQCRIGDGQGRVTVSTHNGSVRIR